MGLEAKIWAWRLGEGGRKKEEKKKKEVKKILHMCESIGHGPLWVCCPKRNIERKKKHFDCLLAFIKVFDL